VLVVCLIGAAVQAVTGDAIRPLVKMVAENRRAYQTTTQVKIAREGVSFSVSR